MDTKLEVVVLPVSDADRTKQFYKGQGLLVVIDDIEAARAQLVERGGPVSEVFHGSGGRFHPEDAGVREPGRDPEAGSYQSHAVFSDPDGNGWVLQEITTQPPGRE